MANFQDIKAQTGIKFFKSAGTGTDADPFVPEISSNVITTDITEGINNFNVTVNATSTTILSANANRKLLILVNDSNQNIYITLGETAVINSAIRLNANGGSLTLDNPIYTGQISAICASGNKKIIGVEG